MAVTRKNAKRLLTSLAALLIISPLVMSAEVLAGAGVQGAKKNRDERLSRLLLIVRDESVREKEPQRLAKAIVQLGEMKAAVAIPDLVRLLDFQRHFGWEHVKINGHDAINEITLITNAKRYPAIGTLFEIGRPALPALVEAISVEETDSLASENAIETVVSILREHPEEGVALLRRAAASAKSPQASQNLLAAALKVEQTIHRSVMPE